MPLSKTTVAGAGEFTGAAGLGLVTFAAEGLDPNGDPELCVFLLSYGFNVEAPQTPFAFLIDLFDPGGGSTSESYIVDSDASEFSLTNICGPPGLAVPKENDGVSWQMRLITLGKAETGTFTVHYTLRRIGQ